MKKNKIKLYETPKKIQWNKSLVFIVVFLALLLIGATATLVIIFWDSLIRTLTKSGMVFLLLGIGVIILGGSTFIISKILSHDRDEF